MISAIKVCWMSLCSRNKKAKPWLALAFAAGLLPFPCLAQDITEVTPLSFGDIALTSYNNVARITITGAGSVSTNSYVHLITQPTRGEYSVTSAPANAAYTVTLPLSVNVQGPGGVYFILDNFQVSPALHTTDASGEDTFYIGARLQTQGGGVNYLDGNYDGAVTITLAF